MEIPRREWIGLALALAAYALVRALVLHTNFDEFAMPQFELFPMGTIPLLSGVEGGLPVSRVYDNSAGQLLVGWLATPFYALFGETYLALKLVPLTLGAFALVFLWLVVRDSAGPRAANLAGFLFALAPTTLVKYSTFASGNHFETLAFNALALWATLRLHRKGASAARLFAVGVAWGFAAFVFLGALSTIVLLAAVHLGLRGWRDTLRDSPWLAGGFALGVSPLLALNAATGWRGFEFLQNKFTKEGSGTDLALAFERLVGFLGEHLVAATQFRDFLGLSGEIARWLFLAAFGVSYALLLPSAVRGVGSLLRGALGRGTRSPTRLDDALATILCAYLPMTALAFATSGLEIAPKDPPMEAEGYRYFNTHLFYALGVIALGAGRRISRPVMVALAAPALAAGLFNGALVDWSFSHTGLGARYDGFNVKQTANQLLTPRNGYTVEQACAMADAYEPGVRAWLYVGMGRVRAMQRVLKARGGELDLWSLLEEFPERARPEVARGVGVAFRHMARVQSRLDARFVNLMRERIAAGDALAPYALEGLATDWEVAVAWDLEKRLPELRSLREALDKEPTLAPHFARGVGAVLGRTLRRGIDMEARQIAEVAPSFAAPAPAEFYAGLGAGLEDGLRPAQLERPLSDVLPAGFDAAAIERGRATRRAELAP
ncbi:MAG: glycosyltransferase family 39 protein [Planctomycetota bacterium]|nr:glycosyltransferase family 39 protein [Planctomycetota bacterium]